MKDRKVWLTLGVEPRQRGVMLSDCTTTAAQQSQALLTRIIHVDQAINVS
jgi:hypothetical protein